MNEFKIETIFPVLLCINSFAIIVLVLNQNENTKDSTNSQLSTSAPNPLEQATWVCLFGQFFLLLIQTKLSDI